MLRINAVSDPGYYLNASGEWDRTGSWEGRGAERLGLSGDDTDAFRKLMANRTPEGKRLTPMDHPERRSGYDLTFSEPKSVSILRELAGDERIDRAREESIREVMRDVVEPLAQTRDRKRFGFHPATTGELTYLSFHHRLGRPVNGIPDMNGHTHVVLPNATWSGGRHLALEIRAIKDAAPLIEAAWHANYANKLRGLGYDIRASGGAFEVEGVHESTIRKFSKRTEIVELEAKARQIKSPKGKAALGALTREKKLAKPDPDLIRESWEARLTPAELRAIEETHRKAVERAESPEPSRDAHWLDNTLTGLLKASSAVPEEKLLAASLKKGVGEVSLPGLQTALASPRFIRGKVDGVAYVATAESMAAERELVTLAKNGAIKLKRQKKGEPPPVTEENESLVPGAEKLRLSELLEEARKAAEEQRRLVLVAPLRDYRDKGLAGSPLVILEDQARLRTGQSRPKPKLASKAIRVGKRIAEKVRRHFELSKRVEFERRLEEEVHHAERPRAVQREWGIGY